MQLLYPIKQKNYEFDPLITAHWKAIKLWLGQAFILTIFGYGAPKSDVEAVQLFKDAWGDINDRSLEQFEVIDINIRKSYFDSWIAKFPRRLIEANIGMYLECRWLNDHCIPEGLSFDDFHSKINELLVHEK